jgi:hypothetical protein
MLAVDFRGFMPGVVVARMWVMRMLTCVVLLACSSCTHPNPPPTPPPAPPVRVACRTSVADYCAANPCDQTLAAAEQGSSLCPATITACGDITVVSQNKVDVSTLWHYQGGQLVAIVNQLSPGQRYVCVAGPEVFVIPSCTLSSQSLPGCGP